MKSACGMPTTTGDGGNNSSGCWVVGERWGLRQLHFKRFSCLRCCRKEKFWAKNTPSAWKRARCVQNRSSLRVVFFYFFSGIHLNLKVFFFFACLPKVHLTFLKGEHTHSGFGESCGPESPLSLGERVSEERGAENGDIPL